jgi:hypothetical protein
MAQLKLVLNRTEVHAVAPASERIEAARSVLCELLMLDEDESVLVGAVSEPLNDIVAELDRLRGVQHLYELWVG